MLAVTGLWDSAGRYPEEAVFHELCVHPNLLELLNPSSLGF